MGFTSEKASFVCIFTGICWLKTLLNPNKSKSSSKEGKEKLELQMKQIIKQFQIRIEKDKQMKIIRHDTRHVLTIVSTLLKEGKKKKAIEFIDVKITVDRNTGVITSEAM